MKNVKKLAIELIDFLKDPKNNLDDLQCYELELISAIMEELNLKKEYDKHYDKKLGI